MNPELQKALLEVVKSAQQVGAVAWDQAPLVLRDLLIAGAIRNGFILLALVSLICVVHYMTRKMMLCNESNGDGQSDRAIVLILRTLVTVIGGAITLDAASTLLTIWLAPRAYLIGLLQ